MELRVDRDLCEANAVCCGLAPEVFELDDEEQLTIRDPGLAAVDLERVRKAVDRCPKNALELVQ